MTETDLTQISTPELRFLRACFHERAGDALAGDPPQEGLSPARLVELAGGHGLGPLLSERLSSAPRSPFTEAALRLLAPTVSRRLRVALQLSGELLAVLDLLRGHGIPAIPYKGPVLAAELYGNPGLRSYRDLDLLLRPGDLARAQELLTGRDYRPLYPLSPRLEAAHLASGYHYNLVREQDGMLLELHWRVADPYFSALGRDHLLWERLRELPFLGRSVPALSPEVLLLCLSVHGAKHHWDQLSHVVDLATLVRAHPQLDFEYLWEAARRSGSVRRLQVALLLARRLVGLDTPAIPASSLQDPASRRLAGRFAARLTSAAAPAPGLIRHARLDLAGMDRLADRSRYLRGILAPNISDWVSTPLPPALGPLLPLLRPFRLLRRYGLLHRARREE